MKKSKPFFDLRISAFGRTVRIYLGAQTEKIEEESDTPLANSSNQKLSKEETFTELSKMEESLDNLQDTVPDISERGSLPMTGAGSSRVLNKADVVENEDSAGISVDDSVEELPPDYN